MPLRRRESQDSSPHIFFKTLYFPTQLAIARLLRKSDYFAFLLPIFATNVSLFLCIQAALRLAYRPFLCQNSQGDPGDAHA